MKRLALVLSSLALLAACSDSGNSSQNDPIDNTPTSGTSAAPADRDPTPQTGTGGQSPVENQTGTEKR